MVEWADGESTALVRQVLPPRRPEWRVQIVDNPDEARAMFSQHLVRVQRRWREVVYDAGLHTVMMHHPLSLVRLRTGARAGLEIWKSVAIRRSGRALSEVRGYLARAVQGNGLNFHRNLAEAKRLALAPSIPRPVVTPQMLARRAAKRLAAMQELAGARYDGGFRVAADAYRRWFSERSLGAFRLFGGDGVPLVAIMNEALEGLSALEDHEFEDFVFQLRWDIERAQQVRVRPGPALTLVPGDEFAPEDVDALLKFLN
jgi:hypothetical protein